jgi:hypothetical protein
LFGFADRSEGSGINMKKAFILSLLFLLVGQCFGQDDNGSAKAKKGSGKMTAEELVRLHLASIGTDEALAAAKSRVMVGTARLTAKVGFTGYLTGPAQVASQGDKVLLAMIFNSNDYPFEKVGYDGKELTVARPTVTRNALSLRDGRSRLGEFIKSQSFIVKQGLLGGALSSAWPLMNLDPKKAKLSYDGLTTMDGRELHKLKYVPARSGDVKVVMYFEPETYRHVMTEYNYTVPIQMGANMAENAAAKPSYYSLIERFSDFKGVGQLTFPFNYTIEFSSQTQDDAMALQWAIKIAQVFFNEPLEQAAFKVS